MKISRTSRALVLAFGITASASVMAEITVGVSVSVTGPGAALGVPYRNTAMVLPEFIGRERARYVIIDDSSDPATAVKNTRKLTAEDRVDIIIGSALTPTSLAMLDTAIESKTAQLVLAPIAIPPAKLTWAFVIPQPVPLMVAGVIEHMKRAGIKTVGYIGFSDGLGDVIEQVLVAQTDAAGIKVIAKERYARNDISVQGQVIKLVSARPDAIFVGAAGTPGALPHVQLIERGYKGPIYHNHGDVVGDFIRVGGKSVEGAIAATGPMMVAEQLADSNPVKKVSVEFNKLYEGKYGADSRNPFSGYLYDAFLLIQHAAPQALAKARPGTVEFRTALRDASEASKEVVGTHGIYSMSPMDHNGLDARARVMVRVENGAWRRLAQ